MKKLLAIILATVMVAAMLPAGIVSAADSGMATYNYVFSNTAHPLSVENVATEGNNAITNTNQLLIDDTIASVSAPWGVSTTEGVKNEYHTNRNSFDNRWSSIYIQVKKNNINSLPQGYAPRAYIEIDVAKSGTFVPTLNVGNASFGEFSDDIGRNWEVFLIPTTEEDFDISNEAYIQSLADSDYRIGIFDSSASGKTVNEFAATYLEKGRYYLLIVAGEPTENSGLSAEATGTYNLPLNSFTLVQVPDASAVNKAYDYDFSTAAFKADVLNGAEEYLLSGASDDTLPDADKVTAVSSYDFVDTTASNAWAFVPSRGGWFNATSYDRKEGKTSFDANGFNLYAHHFGTRIANNTFNPFFTVQVEVPNAGTYDLSVGNGTIAGDATVTSVNMNVFAVPAATATETTDTYYTKYIRPTGIETTIIPTYYVGSRDITTETEGKIGSFSVSIPGTYYITFDFSGSTIYDGFNNKTVTLKDLELKCTSIPAANAATTAKNAQQNVDPENAEKEAVGSSIANVTVFAKDIDGNAIDYNNGIVEEITGMEVGTTKLLTAPEIDGYRFDYWARGIGENSRPVSTNPEYLFKATKGGSKFYAVYSVTGKSEACWVEFYDSNRELVERTKYDAGDTVTVPALPTSSARGEALIWASAVSDYEFDYEGGATFTAPNRAILAFVAEYSDDDASLKDVEVTVAGTTHTTGAGTYKFGETVTVVAPARENNKGTKVFAYWTKGGEIVSFDASYSFVATNDVTVTAVYQDYAPIATSVRKILVDSVAAGSNSEVFAEFIGCDGALERGFIFGNADVTLESAQYKASMKNSAAKSFSMINDVALTAKAYAIFADGVIYSK